MADFLTCDAADLADRTTTLFTTLAADADALKDLAPYEIEAGDEIARGLALAEEFRAALGTQAAEKAEAVTATGTAALDDPSNHHEVATAFGLDAAGWVSLAMLVVIAIMLWKKVPAAIGRSLDKKIAGIRAQLDEASRLRAEAEAQLAEAKARNAASAGDAAAIIAHAEAEAKQMIAKAESDSADLVARRRKMAEDKIAAAERSAIDEVRAKVATAATSAAERLIRERMDAGADKAMVDSAISELGRS